MWKRTRSIVYTRRDPLYCYTCSCFVVGFVRLVWMPGARVQARRDEICTRNIPELLLTLGACLRWLHVPSIPRNSVHIIHYESGAAICLSGCKGAALKANISSMPHEPAP